RLAPRVLTRDLNGFSLFISFVVMGTFGRSGRMRLIGTWTPRTGRTIVMRTPVAAGAIIARGTVRSPVTAAFIAISRRAVATGRTFSPHTPRAFVGIIAGTIITPFITSPTPTAFITVPIPVSVARWWPHFVAIIVTWTKTESMWRAVETSIG